MWEMVEDGPRTYIAARPLFAWGMAVGLWVLLSAYCVAVGWAQKGQTRGSFRRLIGVSIFLGSLGALPSTVLAAFVTGKIATLAQWQVAALSTFFCLLFFLLLLMPPVFLVRTKAKLPLVTDEKFLQHIDEMSRKMRIRTPIVRCLPSLGVQLIQAYAGTLQEPQLVVCDGLIHRLNSDECDAIVAHELGHIANKTLPIFGAIWPVCGALTTVAAHFLSVWVEIPFLLALYVGLKRLASRIVEFDCDKRAARVIGFQTMSTALAKVHAASDISNSGILSLLVFATATHPSRNARLAAIYDAAPESDRPETVPNGNLVQKSRTAALCVTAIWFSILVGTLYAASFGQADYRFAILLMITALAPKLLIQLSLRKFTAINRRRSGAPSLFSRYLSLALLSVAIAVGIVVLFAVVGFVFLSPPQEPEYAATIRIVQIIVALAMLAGLSYYIYLLRRSIRIQSIQQEIAIALRLHDFSRVRDLCHSVPAVVQNATAIRHNLAIAEAALGNREAAIEGLEQLCTDQPSFHLSALVLCILLIDAEKADRAVEIASKLREQLPNDPSPPIQQARAFLQLGQLDAAIEANARASALVPDNGSVMAVSAAIELQRGRLGLAKMLVAKALELAPGDSYSLVIQAEIAIQSEAAETARQALNQAVKSVRSNPFVFLESHLSRLDDALKAIT